MSFADFASRQALFDGVNDRLAAVNMGLTHVSAQQVDFQSNLNVNWVIVTSGLIAAMQIGTTLFEAGSARRGNFGGILVKNLVGAIITGLMWWIWGWALSFGYANTGSLNGFVGNADLLLVSEGVEFPITRYAFWAFQWTLCNQATNIFFGATTERLTLFGTYVYSFLFSGFIYPIIAHWIWSQSGWLSTFNGATTRLGENGLIDFAGATVVHLCGGFAALAGAIIIERREGRFEAENVKAFAGQSQVLKTLGALIVWFGYYGFTTGGSHALALATSEVVAKVAITTSLSAGGAVFVVYVVTGGNVGRTASAAIAGLVAISGACSVVEPWAALVIGIVGGLVYNGTENALLRANIDDAASAFAIHGATGVWGTLAVGIFATKYNTQRTLGRDTAFYGFLYGGGANQFGVQFMGVVVVGVWAFVWSLAVCIVLKALGRLRVSSETESLATVHAAKSEAYVSAYLGLVTSEHEQQESNAVLA